MIYFREMTREKKCIFCGEAFVGQRKNFEHIVPRWLVVEADLAHRDMKVRLPGRTTSMGMGRIGIKVCATCNDSGSHLESAAKEAYLAIAEGNDVSELQARTLLDWLDKMRIGLWLWLVEQTRETAGVQPKFHINARIAAKDRLLFVRRYPPDVKMRGLGFTGLGPYFIHLPGTLGMLINNIYIGSASGDFLVLRHIRSAGLKLEYGNNNRDLIEVLTDRPNEPRIELLGGPSVFGQCIMPTGEFDKHSVPLGSISANHEGWAESPVMKLDGNLREWPQAPAGIPLSQSATGPNVTLMKINVEKIAAFLVRDWMRGDMSALDEGRKLKLRENSRDALDQILSLTDKWKLDYLTETGLRLP